MSLSRNTLTVMIAASAAGLADAQVPGVPALQNAFANPGLAVAANVAGGDGQSFLGLAGAYGLGAGRLQASAAAGMQRAARATRGAYGARVAATLWTSSGGSLGAGAFAGVGGAPRTRDEAGVTTNAAVLQLPVGITIGYRRPLGARRGFSVYGSPLYRWARSEANAVTTSSGSFALAAGLDLGITPSLGLTVGGELSRARKGGGPAGGTLFGGAVSFVPGGAR